MKHVRLITEKKKPFLRESFNYTGALELYQFKPESHTCEQNMLLVSYSLLCLIMCLDTV